MVGLLYYMISPLSEWMSWSLAQRFYNLFLLMFAGGAVYFLTLFAFGFKKKHVDPLS